MYVCVHSSYFWDQVKGIPNLLISENRISEKCWHLEA